MLTLFYVEIKANCQGKNDSFKLMIESYSKYSAAANAISYLYQYGFNNIEVSRCHIATSEDIKSYLVSFNITIH